MELNGSWSNIIHFYDAGARVACTLQLHTGKHDGHEPTARPNVSGPTSTRGWPYHVWIAVVHNGCEDIAMNLRGYPKKKLETDRINPDERRKQKK